MSTVISVENMGKEYNINRRAGYVALRDVLINVVKKPFRWLKIKVSKSETFWALKDVSFDVQKGEVLGIIGANGAGKSTLLKLLSRITTPTTGSATIHGRVSSLLEVGTGFHPELSGRENIFLNGSILGMTRAEIKDKFEDIVEFAGVRKFLEMPVKRYSSGMQVRLAFAVAAHLDPDILIVDEVLAVGDAAFQKKSLAKMEKVTQSEGRTILFVSHNMGAITKLCSRVVWLEDGKVKKIGPAQEVVEEYLQAYRGTKACVQIPKPELDMPVRVTQISVMDDKGELQRRLDITRPFSIKVDYVLENDVENGYVGLNLIDLSTNVPVIETHDIDTNKELKQRTAGLYSATFTFPAGIFNSSALKLFVHAGVFPGGRGRVHKSDGDITLALHDGGSFATHVLHGKRKAVMLMPIPCQVKRH